MSHDIYRFFSFFHLFPLCPSLFLFSDDPMEKSMSFFHDKEGSFATDSEAADDQIATDNKVGLHTNMFVFINESIYEWICVFICIYIYD
jgi:hypothetical protein